MTTVKTSLLMLTLILILLGLSFMACDDDCDCDCEDDDDSSEGDDDATTDDDSTGDDDDSGTTGCTDLNQECLDWYVACWGADAASFAQDFCTVYIDGLNQYWDSSSACIQNAQCEFFGCLQVNAIDCIAAGEAASQAEVDACWTVYEATANSCS